MKPIATILAEIPHLAYEAWATWGTNPISDDGQRGRKVPNSIVLADLDRLLALDRRHPDSAHGVLSGWARAIIDEMDEADHPHDWPADTVDAACAWLNASLRWCHGRGFETELHKDLRRLHGILRGICRVTDSPMPCLTHGCRGQLREVDGMLECEHGHRHDGLRKWRHHPSMPIEDAADRLNVPARTIRSWVTREVIPTDSGKGEHPRHVWPWDILRQRYPALVELVELAEKAA